MNIEAVANTTFSTLRAVLGLSRWSHSDKMAALRSWHSEVAQSKGGA